MGIKIAAIIAFLIANVLTLGLMSLQSNFVKHSYAASSSATNSTNSNNLTNTTSKTIQTILEKEAAKIIQPSSSNDIQTTTTKNTIALENPFYIEYIKAIRQQPLLYRGLHAIGVIFIGKGTVNGTTFIQPVGQAIIIPLSKGIADIGGGGLIKANNGKVGNATFSFREIGRYNPSTQPSQVAGNQSMQGTGAAIFNANATGNLSFLSNTVVMFKAEGNPSGGSIIKGWEWK